MNRGELFLFVGLLAYVHSAPNFSQPFKLSVDASDVRVGAVLIQEDENVPKSYETVWLKDVTATIQNDKRTLDDPDLPAQLTFHLRRGLDVLTLTLNRNDEINPNADIYVVQTTEDGQPILSKTTSLEKEDVAYYQDMDNRAYMTARCVKRLKEQCDRVIHGNIQIGDITYELQSPESSDTSGEVFGLNDVIGKRYLLLDQTNLVENKDTLRVSVPNLQEELKALFRRNAEKEGQNYFSLPDAKLPPQNVGKVHDRGSTDTSRQLKQNYYVKVGMLIDSSIWDIYFSRESYVHPTRKREDVKRKIREAYLHVMNGVNLRYKSIDNPSISITVIPMDFIFFLHQALFPHNASTVIIDNGRTYIDLVPYLDDIFQWDKKTGSAQLPECDAVILFTAHIVYLGQITKHSVGGLSYMGGVCDFGSRTSIVEARHYQKMVQSATHELGHTLGADHDGEGEAFACKSEDAYIMTNHHPHLKKDRTYIRNLWYFSTCSVESFKKTLQNKDCVKKQSAGLNIDVWTMRKQPGDVFTPQEQCVLIYGPGSKFYGTMTEEICHLLSCMDPTERRKKRYVNAARGTRCGENKWCIDGRCVSRSSK